MMSSKIFAPIVFTSLLLALPTIANAAAAQGSVSLLSSARSIQVQETLQRAASDGELPPPSHITVAIERPNKVKLVFAPAPGRTRPNWYLDDGTAEYDYDGGTNLDKKNPAPSEGASTVIARRLALVDLILNNGGILPVSPGENRTVTSGTLDGKTMRVLRDTTSRTAADGSSIAVVVTQWIDAKKGLPFRLLVSRTAGGVTRTILQVKFSNWVLDKPIPAAQFAWTPPKDAKLTASLPAPKRLNVGAAAPDFSAITPEGKTVRLSDYKGKTVVLDFWATWCGPCQAAMPHLESVYQQVKDKDVTVLAVCVWDTKPEYDKWTAAKKGTYSFPTAYDPAGNGDKSIAGSLYGVSGIPTQYVIDKDGKVAAAYAGFAEDAHSLEDALKTQGVDLTAPAKSAAAR